LHERNIYMFIFANAFPPGPYYKSKLELKLNSSEILPVTCKFICFSTPT